ncbi:MAG: hypothetical protein Q6L68_05650 [Thermostichus sp. DG02_5_bins_236]
MKSALPVPCLNLQYWDQHPSDVYGTLRKWLTMYILELLLKGNPAAIVIHQKEEEAANQAYQSVVNALKKGSPESLELTCDRTGKKVFVLTSELCGVQMTSKSGGASPMGSRTGFLAQVES